MTVSAPGRSAGTNQPLSVNPSSVAKRTCLGAEETDVAGAWHGAGRKIDHPALPYPDQEQQDSDAGGGQREHARRGMNRHHSSFINGHFNGHSTGAVRAVRMLSSSIYGPAKAVKVRAFGKALRRRSRFLPGGVDSPVRAFKAVGGTPIFMARARGSRIEDVDGNTYIDYVMSWGPLIHGHAPKGLRKALAAAAARGTSFGAPTELETAARRARGERSCRRWSGSASSAREPKRQ